MAISPPSSPSPLRPPPVPPWAWLTSPPPDPPPAPSPFPPMVPILPSNTESISSVAGTDALSLEVAPAVSASILTATAIVVTACFAALIARTWHVVRKKLADSQYASSTRSKRSSAVADPSGVQWRVPETREGSPEQPLPPASSACESLQLSTEASPELPLPLVSSAYESLQLATCTALEPSSRRHQFDRSPSPTAFDPASLKTHRPPPPLLPGKTALDGSAQRVSETHESATLPNTELATNVVAAVARAQSSSASGKMNQVAPCAASVTTCEVVASATCEGYARRGGDSAVPVASYRHQPRLPPLANARTLT